jgi:hypothetical protein
MGPQASQALAELAVATKFKAPMQSQAGKTQREQVQQLTNASYQLLKGFIETADPRQQHYGLVKQVWKGCVDWVAPENVEAWKRGCEARAAEENAGGGVGQQQATHGEWRYQLANNASVVPKIAPDTSSAAQPQARKLNEGEVFVVTERRQGASQTYLKLQTGGWAFTHHPSTGREICSLQQSASSSPPNAPPIAAIQVVHGCVEVKMKGTFGDKWIKAACEYNPATHEFSSTDSKGKQQRVADCWVVDVPNRSGKRQHRFDIDSDENQQPIALAAESAGEKQQWMVAVETTEALRARQEQARQDQALMTKYSVSTIEEARRKEAEVVQRQREEEERRKREVEEKMRREAVERSKREAEEQRAKARRETEEEAKREEAERLRRKAERRRREARRKEAEERRNAEAVKAILVKYGVGEAKQSQLQQQLQQAQAQQDFNKCKWLQGQIERLEKGVKQAQQLQPELCSALERKDFAQCETLKMQIEVAFLEFQQEEQRAKREAEEAERLRREAEEQALMAKYGVSTIEEARRKAAEAVQRQREEEERRRREALMAEHGATHGM